MNKQDMEKLIEIRTNNRKSGYEFINAWLKIGIPKSEAEDLFEILGYCNWDLVYFYIRMNTKYKDMFFEFLNNYTYKSD